MFDLQGLLQERTGYNLRNQVAHGLLDHDQFWSEAVVYLWWLALRMCVLPIVNERELSGSADHGAGASGGSPSAPLADGEQGTPGDDA